MFDLEKVLSHFLHFDRALDDIVTFQYWGFTFGFVATLLGFSYIDVIED